MQKFWDMVLSYFLSFTVVVLEVMIFQNKKSVVLEVGKNHKDCFDHGIELNGCGSLITSPLIQPYLASYGLHGHPYDLLE